MKRTIQHTAILLLTLVSLGIQPTFSQSPEEAAIRAVDLALKLYEIETKDARLALLKQHPDLVNADLVSVLNRLGNDQAKEGKFEVAFGLNDVATEVALFLNEKRALAWSSTYRGLIFYYQAKYTPAFKQFQDGLSRFREIDDRASEAKLLTNIGIIYQSLGDYQNALTFGQDSLKITREIGDRNGEAKSLANIGALPESLAEVRAISSVFPKTQPFLGRHANETAAKTTANDAAFLHFATHGYYAPYQGMYSGLVLAEEQGEDGYLEAREILQLTLNASMVVLSACDTGRGERNRGEGIIGLSWAFRGAGCASTVVSQWKVADASTASLMKGFYSHLVTTDKTTGVLKKRMGKAEALRHAQLEILRTDRWQNPYHWAPFLLVGEWR
jgi:tetratricopeptide (TPR) repeat protein